jgi:hypothetical protein
MVRCLDNGETPVKETSISSAQVSSFKTKLKLKASSIPPKEKIPKEHVLAEIYDLSSYVIECIVNYGVSHILGYDKLKDVKVIT